MKQPCGLGVDDGVLLGELEDYCQPRRETLQLGLSDQGPSKFPFFRSAVRLAQWKRNVANGAGPDGGTEGVVRQVMICPAMACFPTVNLGEDQLGIVGLQGGQPESKRTVPWFAQGHGFLSFLSPFPPPPWAFNAMWAGMDSEWLQEV